MNIASNPAETAEAWMQEAAKRAKAASAVLATAPATQRNAALTAAAAALRARAAAIEAANANDLAAFDAAGGTKAFRDRLGDRFYSFFQIDNNSFLKPFRRA